MRCSLSALSEQCLEGELEVKGLEQSASPAPAVPAKTSIHISLALPFSFIH